MRGSLGSFLVTGWPADWCWHRAP